MENNATGRSKFKKTIVIIAVIGSVVIGAALIIGVIGLSVTKDVIYMSIVVKYYPVTILLPFAGIGALVLVFLLEYARGPIEFEGLGFRFKGASGPLVLWVFVYLAMASTIALLWDKTVKSKFAETMLEEKLKTATMEERYRRCQIENKAYQKYTDDQISKLCAAKLNKASNE